MISDNKAFYSQLAKFYLDTDVANSAIDKERYNRSKLRELRHNESWKKNPVDLVVIVEKFAPNPNIYHYGVKLSFIGDRYEIITDLASGYLRIRERSTGKYIRLDGAYGNRAETHFKINRREKMQCLSSYYLLK